MTGTFLNIAAVLIGGILGLLFGARIPDKLKATVIAGMGLFTTAMGLQMFLKTENPLIVLGSLLIGTLLGEWWRIEDGLQNLGKYLEQRFSKADEDGSNKFVRGFLSVLGAESGLHLVAYGFVNQGALKVRELSAYRGMYQTGDAALVGRPWVDANVREGHGPLGALYPRDGGGVPGTKEGDTPSFLGLLPAGLQAPEHPDWGGWGGRFRLLRDRLWVDAPDLLDGSWTERHTVSRWRDAFQRELAARMDWMTADRFEDANHPPAPAVDGEGGLEPLRRTVRPVERLVLDASRSSDPGDQNDKKSITNRWSRIYRPSHYRSVPSKDRLGDCFS